MKKKIYQHSPAKHRLKSSTACFPTMSPSCRKFDDFGRLMPEKNRIDLVGGNRMPRSDLNDSTSNISPALSGFGANLHYLFHRRQRGEKRSIPEEQKDEKYFERRKRNNEAAKKSRDARKIREDRVGNNLLILL